MELSVDDLCTALVRSSLVPAAEVKNLSQNWRRAARDMADEPDKFLKWLVGQNYVTEYQGHLLARGHTDHFFLNQYKILDRIGQGRMAGIYKSVHNLGQVVAIKVLPPSKARQAETFTRFQREARMALRLKHPNVVRTFQLGESSGLHYLVMEYLEGEILEEILKKNGPLAPTDAVRVFYQALLGLQHIYDQGMVHRDLKPANLMLVPEPVLRGGTLSTRECTVKILDIGLGRMFFDEEAGGENEQLTASGTLLGSPDYMAPEQARNAHTADIRADIYSLGCGLYHALVGQPPFADPNPVRVMIRHSSEAPRPLRDLNPAVPSGLQDIINCMLAKDPAQRYPTPERAAQALQVFLSSSESDSSRGADPKMQAYLHWLDAQPVEEEGSVIARQANAKHDKAPVANPLAAPLRSQPSARAAAVAPAIPRQKSVPEPTPSPRKKQAPVGLERLARDLAADEKQEVAPAPTRKPLPAVKEPVRVTAPEPGGMSTRDILLLGIIIGIAGAALTGGLAFLVLQLIH